MELTDYLVISMFLTFIGFLFLGIPVAYCLAGAGVIFSAVGYLCDMYLDTRTGIDLRYVSIIVYRIFDLMSNWLLVSVPMFVFMGMMLEQSGIAKSLLTSAQELFGRVRGGLAIVVILIGVLLAASTGIIGASVVLLGLVSLPLMLKQRYSKPFAIGVIAASGTLGILIPPSIMLVVMGDRLALSVGDLFMGAVFPGLILAASYMVYVLIFSYLVPSAAPIAADHAPISSKVILNVLKHALPPTVLIVAVLGSIFLGICTVTESSGIGAFATIILALVNKKLTIGSIKVIAYKTCNIMGYLFGIMIAASFFAIVLRALGASEFVERILLGLPFGAHGMVIMILLVVFVLGFFLDWIEITLIILPLIAPVIGKLDMGIPGFGVIANPTLVWFTICIAITLQTSFLTPPVGMALFYLRGVAPPEVKTKHMYIGIIPFVSLQFLGLVLIFIWPSLVTWLPAIIYR